MISPRYETALKVHGYRTWHIWYPADVVAARILGNNEGSNHFLGSVPSPPTVQVALSAARIMRYARATEAKIALRLREIDLSSFATTNEKSSEEDLLAMLGSHPWEAEDAATINTVNERGQNLAHLCAQLGYNELLLAVIEWGIDISTEDVNGWTPLDFSRLHGDEGAVDILEGDWVDSEGYARHPHRIPMTQSFHQAAAK
jgi:hypothetical protein